MPFRKFKADFLFDGKEIFKEKKVLIVTENGIIENIVAEKDAGDNIEIFEGLICPGFVNCHCHLELSHLKGLIPENTGLVDFVFSVVTQRYFPEEEILESITNAENEMLQNGIVAVGDICNNTLTIPQKQKQRLTYYNFIEASGWLETIAQSRFERSLTFYKSFQQLKQNNSNKDYTSIVPHAPYSVSENLWQLMQPYFRNKIVTIHNQETVSEDELFIQASGDFLRMYQLMNIDNNYFKPSGKSSLQTYFFKLKNAENVLLVHNTFTKQEDISYAIKTAQENNQQLFWCLCPNANMYIENALPPVELLKKNNCNIVLGTDSLASNRSLNILDEIKIIQQNFPTIQLEELLTWATLKGATALGMDNMFGSFEKGKTPGVVLIENIENKQITKHSAVIKIL